MAIQGTVAKGETFLRALAPPNAPSRQTATAVATQAPVPILALARRGADNARNIDARGRHFQGLYPSPRASSRQSPRQAKEPCARPSQLS